MSCGRVQDAPLIGLPDDVEYPLVVLHAYDGSDGALYYAADEAALNQISLFVRPDDDVFVAETSLGNLDPGSCSAFAPSVFCNPDCVRPRRSFVRNAEGSLEPAPLTSIEGRLSCNTLDVSSDCNLCS